MTYFYLNRNLNRNLNRDSRLPISGHINRGLKSARGKHLPNLM